jgi:hypothetical protein
VSGLPTDHDEYWPAGAVSNFVAMANSRGVSAARLKLWETVRSGSDNFIDPPIPGYNYSLYGSRDQIFGASGASANTNAKTDGTPERSTLIEGAELLYAILFNTHDGSDRRGIHFISEREIGDLDADGNPEVLDSFGQPLYFSLRRNVNLPDGLDDVTGSTTITTADVQEDVNQNGMTLNGGDLTDTLLNPNKPVDISQIEIDVHSISF